RSAGAAELSPQLVFALAWSGGKDSALALWTLRHEQLEPEALITTVTEGYERTSMHGVRRELVTRQADTLGIPLVEVVIPPACVEARLVWVDPRALDPAFAGRRYDEQLLAQLPSGVDACGENGEFHTFVSAGPIFAEPIVCATGEIVERDRFVFCDLIPVKEV